MVINVMVNITVSTPEDLERVLHSVSRKDFEDARAMVEEEWDEGNTLEQAIEIAETFMDDFRPFTYDDVGLPAHQRQRRNRFRQWASENPIEFSHVRRTGAKGFQDMLFTPFQIDDAGNKTLADTQEEAK